MKVNNSPILREVNNSPILPRGLTNSARGKKHKEWCDERGNARTQELLTNMELKLEFSDVERETGYDLTTNYFGNSVDASCTPDIARNSPRGSNRYVRKSLLETTTTSLPSVQSGKREGSSTNPVSRKAQPFQYDHVTGGYFPQQETSTSVNTRDSATLPNITIPRPPQTPNGNRSVLFRKVPSSNASPTNTSINGISATASLASSPTFANDSFGSDSDK